MTIWIYEIMFYLQSFNVSDYVEEVNWDAGLSFNAPDDWWMRVEDQKGIHFDYTTYLKLETDSFKSLNAHRSIWLQSVVGLYSLLLPSAVTTSLKFTSTAQGKE